TWTTPPRSSRALGHLVLAVELHESDSPADPPSRPEQAGRSTRAEREVHAMAPKKRTARPRPKTPARVRTRRRKAKRTRSAHHYELAGLVLIAIGAFLVCALWAGLNGGPVAGWVTDAAGWAAYVAPMVLVPVGALIV